MFALEDLKVFVKKELVGLKVRVSGDLSLCVVRRIDQMVQDNFFATA